MESACQSSCACAVRSPAQLAPFATSLRERRRGSGGRVSGRRGKRAGIAEGCAASIQWVQHATSRRWNLSTPMRRGLSQAFDSTPGLSLTTLVRAHGPVQANRRPVLSNGKVQIALRAMRVGVTATRTGYQPRLTKSELIIIRESINSLISHLPAHQDSLDVYHV